MQCQLSQANIYMRKKSILNDILALSMINGRWTFIFNIFLAKKKKEFYYFSFVYDGYPLQCFDLMTTVLISNILLKCVLGIYFL